MRKIQFGFKVEKNESSGGEEITGVISKDVYLHLMLNV